MTRAVRNSVFDAEIKEKRLVEISHHEVNDMATFPTVNS